MCRSGIDPGEPDRGGGGVEAAFSFGVAGAPYGKGSLRCNLTSHLINEFFLRSPFGAMGFFLGVLEA